MKYRYTSALSILIVFIGCVVEKTSDGLHIYSKSNKFITPNGYIVGKPIKFRLKDKLQSFDSSVLSSSSLYVNRCYKDSWFKFYTNGKVILGYDSEIPVTGIENIQGQGGYYTVTGNTIVIEMAYTQKSDQWDNLVIKGEINGDTLKFYYDRYSRSQSNIHHFTSSKNDPHPECHYYIASKALYKLKDPDW
jgi:hypothetical protein